MEGNRYSAKRGNIIARTRSSLVTNGYLATAQKTVEYGTNLALASATPLVKFFVPERKFRYRGIELKCLFASHNATWSNERALEIAIAAYECSVNRDANSIELGAVLHSYLPVELRTSSVVDRYQVGPEIVNQDFLEYEPPDEGFDFLISVSTIEHFGIDEHDHIGQPERALQALELIRDSTLSDCGRAILTVPYGYNPEVDRLVNGSQVLHGVSVVAAYLRKNGISQWREVPGPQLEGCQYGYPRRNANGLAVLEVAGNAGP